MNPPHGPALMGDSLQVLWEDGVRAFCRGWRLDADGSRNTVLAVLLKRSKRP